MTLLMLGWSEILIIALIVLLLFGGKKIPELMKGLGKGMKSFKDGMNGVDDVPPASKDNSEVTHPSKDHEPMSASKDNSFNSAPQGGDKSSSHSGN